MDVSIAVMSIACAKTTKEIDRDEPYVLVTAADVSIPVPRVEVVRYGPWADVQKGDTRSTLARPPGMDDTTWGAFSRGKIVRTRFWGLDGTPTRIVSTEGVIFVVSLLEHERSTEIEAVRTLLKTQAFASLLESSEKPFDDRASDLVAAVRAALRTKISFPQNDEVIGTKRLPITLDDVSAAAGSVRRKSLSFTGEGATYTVTAEFVYSEGG